MKPLSIISFLPLQKWLTVRVFLKTSKLMVGTYILKRYKTWQVSWSKLKYFDIKQSNEVWYAHVAPHLYWCVHLCIFVHLSHRFEANDVKVTQTNLWTQQQNQEHINHRKQDLFLIPARPSWINHSHLWLLNQRIAEVHSTGYSWP